MHPLWGAPHPEGKSRRQRWARMEEEEEEGGYVAEGRMLYHSTHHLSKSWEWGGVRLDAWTISKWWRRWSGESGKQKILLTSVCTMEDNKRRRWRRGEEGPFPPLMLITGWVTGDTLWYDEDVEGAMPHLWHKHTSSGFEETLVLLMPLGKKMCSCSCLKCSLRPCLV